MRSCDFLIVGGGIAGLILAQILQDLNQQILLIDKELPAAASKMSSGIINPVTGKRFVLSWKYELLKKHFLDFYKSLEKKYQGSLLTEKAMLQVLNTPEEQNNWLSRTSDPEYKQYLDPEILNDTGKFKLKEGAVIGMIKSIYQIDSKQCIAVLKNELRDNGSLIEKRFTYKFLTIDEQRLKYKDILIHKAIIFTEGFRILDNPYFKWLPVVKLKGEFLNVFIPDLDLTEVYKSEYSLVPLNNNNYWCGSNFSLTDKTLRATENEKLQQLHFLKNNLKSSYQVMSHDFGIRPSSRDRRPIIGVHPLDSRLYVFNGLGTKGFSLAPYCAMQLASNLIFQTEIDPEIDINRFVKKGLLVPPISNS